MVRRGASGRWRFSTGAWVSTWSATSEESQGLGVKRDTMLLIVTVERGFKSRISCNFYTNHSSASSHLSTFEGIPQPCPESLLSLLWDSAAAVGCYGKARHTFYHMFLKALKFHDGLIEILSVWLTASEVWLNRRLLSSARLWLIRSRLFFSTTGFRTSREKIKKQHVSLVQFWSFIKVDNGVTTTKV